MARGRVYPNEIKRIFTAPGGPLGRQVRRVALDVAKEARRIAEAELGNNPNDQVRTGKYARGFRVDVSTRPGRGFQFTVSNRRKYASALEKGARPHIIRARRERQLRFKTRDGRWRQVTVVSHPGNRPYRILQRAAENVVRKL